MALTLVRVREQAYERGTEFGVVDPPNPEATSPVEVDSTTARVWLREKWAEGLADAPDAGRPLTPALSPEGRGGRKK